MFLLVSLCLLKAFGFVLGECKNGCNEPTLLYDDLACKPIFASSEDCCPTHYGCSHIEARADQTDEKCYYHGKLYSIGESLGDDEPNGNCQVGCRCTKSSSGNMGFNCAVLDCPQRQPKDSCYLKHELGKCCSVGEVCPPFAVTCEVDGKTYIEGAQFAVAKTKCTSCVCQQGFKGILEEPFCKKQVCNEELTRQTEIKLFCAPTYAYGNNCCPLTWHCLEAADKIIHASSTSKNSDLKCKFGNNTWNIGDKFEKTSGEKGKLSCECRIPPYVTCFQNYDYPFYASEY